MILREEDFELNRDLPNPGWLSNCGVGYYLCDRELKEFVKIPETIEKIRVTVSTDKKWIRLTEESLCITSCHYSYLYNNSLKVNGEVRWFDKDIFNLLSGFLEKHPPHSGCPKVYVTVGYVEGQ